MAFHCPRCGRVSWSGRDLAEGYCARCRDWTGADDLTLVCDACGAVRRAASPGRLAVTACDRGHAPALMRLRWAVPDYLEPQGLFQYVQLDPLTLAQLGDVLGRQTAQERTEAAAHYIRERYARSFEPGPWVPGVTVDEEARFAAGLDAPPARVGFDLPRPVTEHEVESAFTRVQREWFEATGLLVSRWQADLLGPPPGNNPVNEPGDSNLPAPAASSWETDIWDEEDWADAATWHPDYREL